MRAGWIIGLLASGLATSAAAQSESLKVSAQPDWARVSEPLPVPENVQGPVFLRRQDSQMHIDRKGQHAFVATLVKVLDPSALDLGNFTISWNPASGNALVHAVKVHRSGTTRNVLNEAKFEIIRRENQLETAMLDGNLTAVLKIPDLRVGDELEIAYTLPTQDPTLGQSNVGLLFMAPSPPPGRFSLQLTWDGVEPPHFKATPDLEPLVRREPNAIAIALDNPTTINPPKDAPPRFAWQRIAQFSDFKDWADVSRHIAPLYAKASTLSAGSPVRTEAATIAAASSDPLQRAAAALKLVQQEVRYIYVGLDGGNLTPASAEETWLRRYGDCKGKTALLLALLSELGVPAEAVMVNNSQADDGIDQHLPSPFFFDHILVRVQLNGQSYWLDPTLPHTYGPGTSPALDYRWVLPATMTGGRLEPIKWTAPTRPTRTTIVELDARAGFAEEANIRMTMIVRGREALKQYYQFSSIGANQMESAIRQAQEGQGTWTTVEKVTWRFDPSEGASVFEITGKGPMEWETGAKDSRSFVLPGGGFYQLDKRLRGSNANPEVPFYGAPEFDCAVTTVRLPTATPDKEWSFNTSFEQTLFGTTYRRVFERRDGAIRMVRSLRVIEPEVSVAQATLDNPKVSKFDISKAKIFHDPGSFDGPPSKHRVPASYEVDWVRQPDACLGGTAIAK